MYYILIYFKRTDATALTISEARKIMLLSEKWVHFYAEKMEKKLKILQYSNGTDFRILEILMTF